MKNKRKKSKKNIENSIKQATGNNVTNDNDNAFCNTEAKFLEFLFWLPQVAFVLFEYAIVITLFVLMAKNLFTDDYHDPYYRKFLPYEGGRGNILYSLGVLAIKFILLVRSLFI